MGSGDWIWSGPDFVSGPPVGLQRRILRIKPAGGLRYTREDLTFDGKITVGGDTAWLDGKDHPQSAIPSADSLYAVRIKTRTVDFTFKKVDKRILTFHDALSTDGKTLTRSAQGVNGPGESVSNVMVFDRLSDAPALEIGCWKLNHAKSAPRDALLARWTQRLEFEPGGYRITRESVDLEGYRAGG